MPRSRAGRRYRLARLARAAGAALLAVWLGACVTPSVPIPPPEPERMTFAYDPGEGSAVFTFDPYPSYAFAVVYLFNRSNGTGIIETAHADGSVGPTRGIAAELGDSILVSFELESQVATTCVILQDGRSSSALKCPH